MNTIDILRWMVKDPVAHSIGYSIAALFLMYFCIEKLSWFFKTKLYNKFFKNKSTDRNSIEFCVKLVLGYSIALEVMAWVFNASYMSFFLCVELIVTIPVLAFYGLDYLKKYLTALHNRLPDQD